MNEEKKKEILLKSFDLLKDVDDYDTRKKLADCIGKMYSMDKETAIGMWKYLLQKHLTKIQSGDGNGGLINDVKNAMSMDDVEFTNLVLNDAFLKKVIFSDDPGEYFFPDFGPVACTIIKILMINGYLQEANEYLELMYQNPYRRSSWYIIMDRIIGNVGGELKNRMSENLYELLEFWCEKAESDEDKAKLDIRLMDYID